MVPVLEKQINGDAGSYGVQFKKEERTLIAVNSKLNEAFSELHELKHPRFDDLKMKLLSLQSEVSTAIQGASEVYNRNA
jgi:hypothetical protein